uniref:Uncharacterized protein n=1 Tax=Human betaherpesvirus 6 TaxID=10368 RepID=A0A5P9U5L3_9BETA|nr:hypothetical protein [Human betaherpesvirus 6]
MKENAVMLFKYSHIRLLFHLCADILHERIFFRLNLNGIGRSPCTLMFPSQSHTLIYTHGHETGKKSRN